MFDEIIKHLKGPGLNRSAQFPHFPVERLASNSRYVRESNLQQR